MNNKCKKILSNITRDKITFYPHGLFKVTDVAKNESNNLIEALQKSGYVKHINELLADDEHVTNIVGEINLEPTHRGLTLHRTLNPKIWNDEKKLLPEVREKIIQIVRYFKKAIEEDNLTLKIADVWLLGSNANYNYTDESDLDIHIIAD